MKLKPFVTGLFGLALAGIVAAQDADKSASESKGSTSKTAVEEAEKKEATTDEAMTVIEITGNDIMQFSTKELKVKAGEKVKLKLKHIGKQPKNFMGHNIVILQAGENVMAFGPKAGLPSNAPEYLPKDEESRKAIIAATKMIGGGEETEVEFTISEAGEYPFVCTFPGHFAVMNGKLIAE